MPGPSVPPADAQVFLGRLTRLDPGALVRLRPTAAGRTGLWARLPWGVLVGREVDLADAAAIGDLTVPAASLLAGRPGPRRDADWRWPLPPHAGTVLEEIPARRIQAVAVAAAGTLRQVTATGLDGRPVGARVLREALLDHVPIVVEAAGARVEVSQRLVQAVVRMGFLGDQPEVPVRVRQVSRGPGGAHPGATRGYWLGLAARYGSAWLPPATLGVRVARSAEK